MKQIAQPEALLGWMDSLGDATRLRMLRVLEPQELGVAEICDIAQLPQSTVSRHLKVLSEQGWVRCRREGTTNLYRMTLDELEPAARKLWLLAREEMGNWPTLAQDRLRLKRVLAHRQKDTQAFFASTAGQWDALRDELYGRSFGQAALLALLPSHWTVADLGCGTGAMVAQLAPRVARVIGVDQSAAMLAAARRKIGKADNVRLQRGDLEKLPIADATCDAALMVLVLSYAPRVEPALAEMARVLKPGGRAVVVDLLAHDRQDFRRLMGQQTAGFEVEALGKLLEQAGLTPTGITPLAAEPNVKGPALLLATAGKGER